MPAGPAPSNWRTKTETMPFQKRLTNNNPPAAAEPKRPHWRKQKPSRSSLKDQRQSLGGATGVAAGSKAFASPGAKGGGGGSRVVASDSPAVA